MLSNFLPESVPTHGTGAERRRDGAGEARRAGWADGGRQLARGRRGARATRSEHLAPREVFNVACARVVDPDDTPYGTSSSLRSPHSIAPPAR